MSTHYNPVILRCVAVILCCAVAMLIFSRSAHAMNLYSYNLDSLVYMTTDFVEADLVGPGTESGAAVIDAKVTSVYKGSMKVGQIVALTQMSFFYKNATDYFSRDAVSIGKGDHVFLFLSKAHAAFAVDVPEGANIYWPAPSGVKLVADGKVFSFNQFSNPGPYVAVTPKTNPYVASPTPEEFRMQLARSQSRVATLTPMLDKETSMTDLPHLMQLLRQRSAGDGGDWITAVICANIANLHEPDAIHEAMDITSAKNGWVSAVLVAGLVTPTGRDFLLKAIGDETTPLPKRIGFAYTLTTVGQVYHSVSAGIAPRPNGGVSYRGSGESTENENGSYLTRVALLALANRQHEELCLILLRSLNSLAFWSEKSVEPAVQKDEATALPVLKNLSLLSQSQKVQDQIINITYHYQQVAQKKTPSVAAAK